jgi:hypothetical protein
MPKEPIYRATKQIGLERPLLEAISRYCQSRGGLPITVGMKDLLWKGVQTQNTEDSGGGRP